ncbi:MAG: hypothetical protein M3279_10345 [Actinomycetota bacterium]|nr:hypothetical protein [Actinomycetota bacterium]
MREGRTALAITVLLIATLTVPALLVANSASIAQQGQPSPSGTAPAIQLLNPSDYSTSSTGGASPTTIPGPQISDKDTTDDDADRPGEDPREYHFKAVVSNAPANAFVEFFLIQTVGGQTQTFNLGCAQAGATGGACRGVFKPFGAVELIRDIPDTFTEGPTSSTDPTQSDRGGATVRAVLYANAGQNEVARDDQPVLINQNDRPDADPLSRGEADPQRAAETVEIVYPEHGGLFGLYSPGGSGAGIGVVDVQWSAGTDAVQVFYSTSPTDVDPDWKSCSSSETTGTSTTAASAQNGVRCTLTGSDQPEAVTAVAAVARDNESDDPNAARASLRNNSGDAHRVVGYSQRPDLVSVGDETVSGALPRCSGLLVAQVLDDTQARRPVAGVDVDVHAQGPTDNLAFNTHQTTGGDTEQSQFDESKADRSQPPQNHAQEPGRRCSNNNQSGTQGNHAVGGGPDRKHVESQDDTDDDGRFVFRLWSDAAGRTRATAWADTVDDDRFCADEPSGSGVVTWGNATDTAPAPEAPEPQPCPSPSPSGSPSGSPQTPTGSPTQSPTGSPTQSPSGNPTQTPTGSPTSTPTQTTTASPTGTATTPQGTGTTGGAATTTQQQAVTEVSLEASKSRKTFGRRFTLSGAVESANAACTAFVNVRISRDVLGGADDFQLFAQEQTDGNGAYTATFTADRSANYVAQVDETTACDDSTSATQPVLVRVKVFLRLSDGKVRRGERVRLRARTAPCPATAGDKILLFRAIEGQFGKSGKKRSSASCRAQFTRRVRETSVFQARWPKQVPEFISGRSRSKAVRVTR